MLWRGLFLPLEYANWERKKRLASFDLLNLTAVRGRSYAEVRTELTTLVPELQTPAPCESTLAVEFALHHTLLVSPI